MKSVRELTESRAEKMTALESFLDNMETLTPENEQKFNELEVDVKELDRQIEFAKKVENARRDKAAVQAAKGTPEQRLAKDFSIIRALRSQLPNEKLEGAEAEVHQEARHEAEQCGIYIKNFGIPSSMLQIGTKRDMLVGTPTAGGHAVQTDINAVIPYLRVALKLEQLGATMLTGLAGDQKFPRRDNSPASAWEGETDTTAEISPTLTQFTMQPKRNAAYIEYSKQLLYQAPNLSVEAMVRDELSFQVSKAVDIAGFNGSGASNQPTGLLNTSGIGDVDHGANGGAATWAKVLEFQSTIETSNADDASLRWITTPGVKAKLMEIERAASTAQFILMEPGRSLLGFPFDWSNNIPSNLSDGSGSNLHAMILGVWSNLIVGQWGGLDILVDPYTKGKDAMVTVIINSFWDIGIRQPAAFVAAKDIDVS
jgi:HK97 family phage major capsid protein